VLSTRNFFREPKQESSAVLSAPSTRLEDLLVGGSRPAADGELLSKSLSAASVEGVVGLDTSMTPEELFGLASIAGVSTAAGAPVKAAEYDRRALDPPPLTALNAELQLAWENFRMHRASARDPTKPAFKLIPSEANVLVESFYLLGRRIPADMRRFYFAFDAFGIADLGAFCFYAGKMDG